MTTRPDRMTAHKTALGLTTNAGWLLDLDADDLEVHTTAGRALAVVDRAPIANADGTAHVRRGIRGLGPAQLSLVGEVRSVTETIMHGVYSGALGGVVILMDQYVRTLNGVVNTVVYVISRASGPEHADQTSDAEIIELMERSPDPITSARRGIT